MPNFREALRGLQQAGTNPLDDPLGLAVQARGMQHRQDFEAQRFRENPYSLSGPLPSPKWEGFFQAAAETSGGQPRFGYMNQPSPDLTRDINWASQANAAAPMNFGGIAKSQQLGTPIDSLRRLGYSMSNMR